MDGMAAYDRIDEAAQSLNEDFESAVPQVTQCDCRFLRHSIMEVLGGRVIDPATVILTFCCTRYGSLAFILSEGSPVDIRCIDIPRFSRRDLIDLITRTPNEQGYATEGWLGSLAPYLFKNRTGSNKKREILDEGGLSNRQLTGGRPRFPDIGIVQFNALRSPLRVESHPAQMRAHVLNSMRLTFQLSSILLPDSTVGRMCCDS
jgi:hypothetical protein